MLLLLVEVFLLDRFHTLVDEQADDHDQNKDKGEDNENNNRTKNITEQRALLLNDDRLLAVLDQRRRLAAAAREVLLEQELLPFVLVLVRGRLVVEVRRRFNINFGREKNDVFIGFLSRLIAGVQTVQGDHRRLGLVEHAVVVDD